MIRRILFISVCILFGLAACSAPQSPSRAPNGWFTAAPGATPRVLPEANTSMPEATPETSKPLAATNTPAPTFRATNTPASTRTGALTLTPTVAVTLAANFSGTGKQATSMFEWDGPALFRFDLQKSKSIYSVILLDGSDGQMQTILFSGMGNTSSSTVQGLKKGRYAVNISAPEESAWTLTIAKP